MKTRFKLTDISIKALKAPETGSIIYADAFLPGFGVRVSQGGTKSFVLTHGKLRRREKIGRVGIITLAEARAEAKRRIAEYTLGKEKPLSITWTKATEEFIDDGRAHLKERTLLDYRRMFDRHFRFGDLLVSEISSGEIQRRIDKLRDRPSERHHAFVVAGTFFRWAHRRYYVDSNPMERMSIRYHYRPRTRVLSDDEIRRVWHAAGNDLFGSRVKLQLLTGQRGGEIASLAQDMVRGDVVTLPSWLTKNKREHTFPLGTIAAEVIGGLSLPARGIYKPKAFENYQRMKARLDAASGVFDWRLHDLRRTFASGLAAQGVSLPAIERLLNHVSGSFAGIVGVYQHYNYMPEMRRAISLWETHIAELVGHEEPELPLLASQTPRLLSDLRKAM
jgi:integrase